MLFIRKGLPLVSSTCGWRNKNVKWNSKMKNKTSKAFQRTLLALTGKEKLSLNDEKLPTVSHHVE